MIEMKWSKIEKELARRIFDTAYRRECVSITTRIKEMIEGVPSHRTYGKFITISRSKGSLLTPNTITNIA
jgi:hypothetical protein